MSEKKIPLNDFLDYIYFKTGAGSNLVPRKPAGVVFAVFKVLTRGEKDKKDSSRIKKARTYYDSHYKDDDPNIKSGNINTNDINNKTLKKKIDLVKKFIKANNNVKFQDGRSLSKRVSWGWLNVGEKEFKIYLKAYRDANPAHENFLPDIKIYDDEFSEKDKEKIAKKIQKKTDKKSRKKIEKKIKKMKKLKKLKNMQKCLKITI